MSITSKGTTDAVGLVIVNTMMGGAAGGLTVLFFQKFKGVFQGKLLGKWNHSLTLNGILVGIVSMCAGVNTYQCWEALLVGILAGTVYLGVSKLVLKLKLDDPLDAIAVHGGGGNFNNKNSSCSNHVSLNNYMSI